MADHPVGQPVPLRLDDDELVALGAFLRGAPSPARADQSRLIAIIGAKLTGFFWHVAKVAVEHYDREYPEVARTQAGLQARIHREIADWLESQRDDTWNGVARRPSGFKNAAHRIRTRGQHIAEKAGATDHGDQPIT